VFCQNWEVSWQGQGEEKTADELAEIMLNLQAAGCHNINLVSPSHVVAQILAALPLAVEDGLRLPLVYNSGGYDSIEALRLLDGVVDIYMPDMKYGDPETARKYSRIRDYVEVNQAAVREMHRQVGDLRLDRRGIAERGLLVRHLVLPDGIAGTESAMRFLAQEISPHTYVNIMDQYRPAYRASEYPELNRAITSDECKAAIEQARRAGLYRIDRRNSDRWVIRWP
jgi:putative pyruvate formate lyase activating enzyme